jgi:hypothetical protein
VRVDGRLFYADLDTGLIFEFLLPQFAARHPARRADRAWLRRGRQWRAIRDGHKHAIERNRGIVYAIRSVPEPATAALLIAGGLALAARRRGGWLGLGNRSPRA